MIHLIAVTVVVMGGEFKSLLYVKTKGARRATFVPKRQDLQQH